MFTIYKKVEQIEINKIKKVKYNFESNGVY